MLSVVAGHIFPTPISSAVYLYHLPIFFLITGIFLKPDTKLKDFFTGRIMGLIIPSITYSLLLVATYIISYILGANPAGFFSTLWFVPALLASSTVAYVVIKYCNNIICVFFTVVAITISYSIQIEDSNYEIIFTRIALHAFSLVMLGYVLKGIFLRPQALFGWMIFIVIIPAIWPVLSYNIKEGNLGVYIITLLMSILAIEGVFGLSVLICKYNWLSKYITVFGKNSLSVMFIHQPVQILLNQMEMLRSPLLRFSLTVAICFIVINLIRALPPRVAPLFYAKY